MRREVQAVLTLDAKEAILLDKHSLLNLCNVLELQLSMLSEQLGDRFLRESSRRCLQFIMDLGQSETGELIPGMAQHCSEVEQHLRGLAEEHTGENPLIEGLLETVAIGHARIEEFKGPRFSWREIGQVEFRRTLERFLNATERVSKGRFRFVYAPQPRDPAAYRVDFRVAAQGPILWAPGVLHDTIRDLVGNSRKYSELGSEIRIELKDLGKEGLRLRVTDEGMGIPEDEIERVVQFGYRGSNALDRRTMGGGFGLTKAYNLCKRFHGQFVIESEIGKGTTIEMTLLPPD
jgi:signal transduction histidine kinase